MDEILRQAVIVLRGMWRYRWLGLATAWIVGAIGVAVTMNRPEKYEASARIFVNTDSMLKPLMSGMTVPLNIDQRIEMLSRIVISRPNVEKLVHSVGLDAEAKTPEATDKLVDAVISRLTIMGAGRANLYILRFHDPEPERAKRVIDVFASMFIESGQGGKISDTDAAKKFIDEQVAVYEKKLQEAENRLKEFKLRYLGMAEGEGKDYFVRMSEASALLSRAQLELREAENSRDTYRREVAKLASEETNFVPSSTVSSNSGGQISEIDARLEAMGRNLDLLLQRYTDSHPDVVGVRRVIADLELQKRRLVAARTSDSSPLVPSTPGGTRAYELLKVSLAAAEANAASLRTRVAEYSDRYNRLRESAKRVPQLEAEYAQLNRDYDVNKKNYESLVSRRESANMSGEMQTVSGVADFRVVDPPRVSPSPVFPNRFHLIPLTLLLALIAGFAVAFVATELRPAFYDGRSLREATGLALLGTVSMVVSESSRQEDKKRMIRFLSGVGVLLGVYAAGMVALLLRLTVRMV